MQPEKSIEPFWLIQMAYIKGFFTKSEINWFVNEFDLQLFHLIVQNVHERPGGAWTGIPHGFLIARCGWPARARLRRVLLLVFSTHFFTFFVITSISFFLMAFFEVCFCWFFLLLRFSQDFYVFNPLWLRLSLPIWPTSRICCYITPLIQVMA